MMILLLLVNTGCAQRDGAGEQATIDQWVEQAGEESQPQKEPPATDKKEPSAEEPKEELQEQPQEQQKNIEYRIDPKLSSVIRQIESDFSKTMEEEGTYLVSRYYGAFNGAVPVMMSGYGTDSGSHEDTVADSVFHYTDGDSIKVWEDGKFYSMEDAYAQGLLTKEQVATVADRHKNGTDIKMDGISEGIHTPDDELLEQIKSEYIEQQLASNKHFREEFVTAYYGIYSGAVAVYFFQLIEDIPENTNSTIKIDSDIDSDIKEIKWMLIWADGMFLKIQDAYDQKVLTIEQINTIKSIKNKGKAIIINH